MIIEYEQLLGEKTTPQMRISGGNCIYRRFEEQVEWTPEAIALSYEQHSLSYRGLNDRANQLARYLQSAGVGPGILVGLCMERSLAMVISVLAVLKAGGGYVPLDPAYPAERLAFMLHDAQVSLLLTRHVADLPAHNVSVIDLDSIWGIIARESTANPDQTVTDHDPAYVIYTSGSTDVPKGVLIEHGGLVNMIEEQIRIFGVQPQDNVAQFASWSFDASVSELFLALLAGAHLSLIPQDQRWPAPTLAHYLQEYRITTITLPPSVLAVLPAEDVSTLHTIISAGEELSAEIAARWSVERKLFNAYGPTETTVCATINQCHLHMHRSSIGYPIANMQIYLLNPALEPVPHGEVGEIYIGGIGLARGYLNRPELTQEKFLPHPFSNEPGARLYKTGDLARYLSDGSIECIGRMDRMVKVRGFRIELGEVEAVLEQHPLVLQSLVAVYKDHRGAKRLAAYVITQPEYACNERLALLRAEVAHFLQRKLPKYMLPAAFIILNTFPLTPNGKIDQRALPPPDPSSHMMRYSKESK